MIRYYEDNLKGIPQAARTETRLPIILVVNAMNEHLTLRLEQCAFFRFNQERKVWEAVCMDGTVFTLRHRTTADTLLNYSGDLIQIHKRYIVNINHIKKIQDSRCILNEPMDDYQELKISKNYRQSLLAAFYVL